MRKKVMAMIWIILFLMLASSGTAYAAEVSLRLDKSVLYPSDTVIVSGTADPNTWLTLKVLDSLGNICVFDATLTDDLGNYSIPFIAPDSPDGYTVVAGYGNKTGTQSFQIRPLPGSDDSSGGGNDGGGSTDGDGNGGSGSTGGGGGSSITPATPTNEATVSGTGISETSLPVNVNTQTGNAATDLGPLAEDIFSGTGTAVLTLPTIPGVSSYTLEISAVSLADAQEKGGLTFSTGAGSITIPSGMLANMPVTAGKQAEITIGQGDKSNLPAEVQAAVGERPVIQLTLTIDGTQIDWNNPNTPVTVSIPYSPTAEELADPEHIVVWYIDGSGNAVSIPSGRYDPVTETVTFTTTHFSYYAVAYVRKTFSDLSSVEWARKPIEVLASKGVISGTGMDIFSPTASITRADYLVLLLKTLGLTAEFDGNFDDVEPSAYYYEALGIAKKLGLAAGVGNNRFNPGESISRQDMMVLAFRALEKSKGLKAEDTNGLLGKFSDKEDVADYAVSSVAALVKEGLIKGTGDKLNPRAYTTRAEAAVFLYRIYNDDKY